jgi:hypothetical protein
MSAADTGAGTATATAVGSGAKGGQGSRAGWCAGPSIQRIKACRLAHNSTPTKATLTQNRIK